MAREREIKIIHSETWAGGVVGVVREVVWEQRQLVCWELMQVKYCLQRGGFGHFSAKAWGCVYSDTGSCELVVWSLAVCVIMVVLQWAVQCGRLPAEDCAGTAWLPTRQYHLAEGFILFLFAGDRGDPGRCAKGGGVQTNSSRPGAGWKLLCF